MQEIMIPSEQCELPELEFDVTSADLLHAALSRAAKASGVPLTQVHDRYFTLQSRILQAEYPYGHWYLVPYRDIAPEETVCAVADNIPGGTMRHVTAFSNAAFPDDPHILAVFAPGGLDSYFPRGEIDVEGTDILAFDYYVEELREAAL